jgi:asparagine synthase (glutamine-hydrolysing)
MSGTLLFFKFGHDKGKLFYTNDINGIKDCHSIGQLIAALPKADAIDSTKLIARSGHPFNIDSQTGLRQTEEEIDLAIMNSFDKGNKKFFYSWHGHWSIMLWDEAGQELLIARDKMGNKTIYYYDNSDFLVVTADLSVLLKLSFIPKTLNPNAIIQLGPFLKSDGQTFYKDIHQLPKAHYLRLKNNTLQLQNYWMPEVKPLIHYRQFNDYVAHFNEIYERVMIENVTGFQKTSIALSSGLDSGSMYAAAAPYLQKNDQTIDAITWQSGIIDEAFKLPNRINDETHLVKELIRPFTNTTHHIVTSQEGNILSFHRKIIERCHQPLMNLQPHIMEVFEKGREIGTDMMMNGFGGNFTVSHAGKHELKIKTFLDLVQICQLYSQKAIRRVKSSFEDFSTFRKFTNTSRDYIQQSAIKTHRDDYYALTPHLAAKRTPDNEQYNHIISLLQDNFIQDLSIYTSHLGFESRTPVLDERVIDFCLGVPNHVFNQNGESKRLIKAAMKDKMPDKILFNPYRGLQGSNYISKFIAEAKEINEVFDTFAASPFIRYWLDVDLMKAHLQAYIHLNVTKKSPSHDSNTNIILRGLQLGLFLQNFENGKY